MKVKGTNQLEELQQSVASDKKQPILPAAMGESFALVGYSRTPPADALLDVTMGNLSLLTSPFTYYGDWWSAHEAILMCQRAYYKIPVYRTAIDLMTDLFNTEIHLEGGNAQSLKFFEAWLKRINVWRVREQFGRECFLSGTMIFYRTDATLKASDVIKMTQAQAAKEVDIPIRYELINPVMIRLDSFAYDMPIYYRVMTAYDLKQLENSGDPDDLVQVKDIKKGINKYAKGMKEPFIKLDPTRVHATFYQKQDYMPFAVPMGYCVLEDINLSLELKKADATLARSVEYLLLLITMGSPEKDGGTDPAAFNALQNIFKNNKIGRVLVGDYTTEAKFVSPEIDKLLSPTKYEEVNRNISSGLMNIFFGEQKYADSITKLRALVRKIENAQALFIHDFLQKEIKRIAKIMNFKSYPTASFEPIRLEDPANLFSVYAMLTQAGVFTPEDTVNLMETGLYPSIETLQKNQQALRESKDQGMYQPMQGGPYDSQKLADKNAKNQQKLAQQNADNQLKQSQQNSENAQKQAAMTPPAPQVHLHAPGLSGPTNPSNPAGKPSSKPVSKKAGRPQGKKAPQKTKKVSQTGASYTVETETHFSQRKLAENVVLLNKVKKEFDQEYKKANEITRMSSRHKEIAATITSFLIENEDPDNWSAKIPDYVKELPELDMERAAAISDIQEEFEESRETAALLYHSQI